MARSASVVRLAAMNLLRGLAWASLIVAGLSA
jgi:hypothetical protein